MKILFVYPGIAHVGYNSYAEEAIPASDTHPSYGLALLASLLLERGHEVDLLDLRQQKNEAEAVEQLKQSDADLVAVTVQTPSFDFADMVAKHAKAFGKITVAGGIHATIATEDFLQHCHWDYVIRNEGEQALPELIDALEQGCSPERVVEGEIVADLDSLPLPHLFPQWQPFYEKEYAIEVARGCPGRCSYCISGDKRFYKKMRFRSRDHVMREIDFAFSNSMPQHLLFLDVNASTKKALFNSILSALADKYPELVITVQERVDSFSEETAQILARFKTAVVWFGVESASKRLLNFLRKDTNIDEAERAMALCNKYHLRSGVNVLIGVPTETAAEIQTTFNFIGKIKPYYLYCNTLAPFPGTDIHQYCQEHDLLPLLESYDQYELRNITNNGFIKGIDYQQIRQWNHLLNSLVNPTIRNQSLATLLSDEAEFVNQLVVVLANYLLGKAAPISVCLYGSSMIGRRVCKALRQHPFWRSNHSIRAFISSQGHCRAESIDGIPWHDDLWLRDNPPDVIINTSANSKEAIKFKLREHGLLERTLTLFEDADDCQLKTGNVDYQLTA